MASEPESWSGEAIFARWAPEGAAWSPWVKPLLFAEMSGRVPQALDAEIGRVDVSWAPETTTEASAPDGGYREMPERTRMPAPDRAALVLDLPGSEAVLMGLALIARGYRPIPLFNGSSGGLSGSRAGAIGNALAAGSRLLGPDALPSDAPPAFLLDSTRLDWAPLPGQFDGRWIVFPQDFPSATTLRAHGIERVIWRSRQGAVAEDLAHVLLAWRPGGVVPWASRETGSLEKLEISEPSGFRSLLRRAAVVVGLRRNSAGGFGAMVPVPQQSSGGYG